MSELKGYSYREATIKKVMKDNYKFSSEILAQVSRETLNQQMLEALNQSGKVYFACRKGEVCGVVMIQTATYASSCFTQDANGTLVFVPSDAVGVTNEDSTTVLELAHIYLTEELKAKDNLIMFDCYDILRGTYAYSTKEGKYLLWGENVFSEFRNQNSNLLLLLFVPLCMLPSCLALIRSAFGSVPFPVLLCISITCVALIIYIIFASTHRVRK